MIADGVPICLRLYVAGNGPNSAAAITNLRIILDKLPATRVELEIIDLLTSPERGALDGVMVTPTLVKLSPLPERRLLGNLCDRAMLTGALGLEVVAHE